MKTRVEELIGSLKVEYPGAREEFLLSLITKAEEEGVVVRERSHGEEGVVWIWLRGPDTPTKPNPSEPEPSRAEALSLPLKQRLISILTRGAVGGKARVDELTRLLELEYPWAKGEFLLSVIVRAEEEDVIMLERDREGVEWVCPRYPAK